MCFKFRLSVKNVLLLSLWYGQKKPDINIFLKQPLKEIDIIQEKQGLV